MIKQTMSVTNRAKYTLGRGKVYGAQNTVPLSLYSTNHSKCGLAKFIGWRLVIKLPTSGFPHPVFHIRFSTSGFPHPVFHIRFATVRTNLAFFLGVIFKVLCFLLVCVTRTTRLENFNIVEPHCFTQRGTYPNRRSFWV